MGRHSVGFSGSSIIKHITSVILHRLVLVEGLDLNRQLFNSCSTSLTSSHHLTRRLPETAGVNPDCRSHSKLPEVTPNCKSFETIGGHPRLQKSLETAGGHPRLQKSLETVGGDPKLQVFRDCRRSPQTTEVTRNCRSHHRLQK